MNSALNGHDITIFDGRVPKAVALALVMWRLAAAYRPVASDAARLVSVFNGPVVAHLLECLEGQNCFFFRSSLMFNSYH